MHQLVGIVNSCRQYVFFGQGVLVPSYCTWRFVFTKKKNTHVMHGLAQRELHFSRRGRHFMGLATVYMVQKTYCEQRIVTMRIIVNNKLTTMRRLKSWRGRQMKQQSFNFRPGKISAWPMIEFQAWGWDGMTQVARTEFSGRKNSPGTSWSWGKFGETTSEVPSG